MSILIVERDEAVRGVLARDLATEGYECIAAIDARGALEQLERRRPDLVLIGLDLGDRRGIDLCRRIRSRVGNPIVAYSSEQNEQHKVRALDAGADDYLVTPLSMPELFARLRVALRHRRAIASLIDDVVLHIAGLVIDVGQHVAAVGGTPLELTPKEYQLLVLLARNAGKVVAHQTILETVWPANQSQDTLRLHISQLRRKLQAHEGAPQLLTRTGVGYTLLPATAPDV
ncbi:MAG: two-component system response regulator [Ilumatobacteraceae bacterium]|nr:two-component system response regulator [Ilumatobacteraceae bacterium]